MKRLVRTGLSATVAFALVMTVTLTAGATEKAVVTAKEKVATEKITSATTVEAIALSVTAEKLIAKWAMEKALRKPEEIEVMKEPIDRRRTAPDNMTGSLNQANYVWFPVSTGGNQLDCANNQVEQTLYPQTTYPTVASLPQAPSSGIGCSGSIYCCAKGYTRTAANFVLTNISGQNYWVPTSATPNAREDKN